MKLITLLILLLCCPVLIFAQNNRLIVTTDIGGTDPDDEQSMVHLLMMSNDIDIEGIICQMAFVKSSIGIDVLHRIIDAYEQVQPNLIKHDSNYPSVNYLRSIAATGQMTVGFAGVGEGKDTPGSELIIRAVDKDDVRPIWLTAWGGMNTIAQALWNVKSTRSKHEVAKFVSKIRIYDVLGQCDAGAWIAKTFPEILYIRNVDIYGWTPSDNWFKSHVQNVGPMGKVFPNRIWATEGDTPAFLYVANNGINLPDSISAGNWGGRFDWKKTTNARGMDWVKKNNLDESVYDDYHMHINTSEKGESISRWKNEISNDFEARMQWSVSHEYFEANHHPMIRINKESEASRKPIYMTLKRGKTVSIDASKSTDPDGDTLSWKWYVLTEASTSECQIDTSYASKSRITIPKDAHSGIIHLIIECKDNGVPALTSYRRIIINIK